MEYFDSVGSLNLAAGLAKNNVFNIQSKGDAAKSFAVLFYSEMMKQALEDQSTVFKPGEDNYFGNISPMTDIFMDRFVEQLIRSGKYDELISKGMLSNISSAKF